MLPDTMYASVDAIQWKTTLVDSLHSGVLDNLDDLYADVPGIFAFRGGSFRDAPFRGHLQGKPDTVVVDWSFTTDYDDRSTDYGVWGGGTGWTGQPLYVAWPDSLMARFQSESPALTSRFAQEEVIVGSLASRLYFINFQTGDSSRRSIPTGNTIKGTPMLDPTLNGNLYVGQGIPCQSPFGAMAINLFTHRIVHFFPADRKAWRGWNAYDSSPLRVGGFLFRAGENGTLYKFRIDGDTLRLHSTLQFRRPRRGAGGMEASMSAFRNYGFVSDNHGLILCVNLNTMRPVWLYDNHDDSDASPVLSVEEDGLFLYSGCEMDRQGSKGYSYLVKLDALTGALVWSSPLPVQRAYIGERKFDGGLFATPLLGSGNCDSLVFYNIVTNEKPGMKGDFVALRKKDGSLVYRTPLKHYAWSSPVALLNEQEELFIFTADTQGRVYLIEGSSGKILFCRRVGANFESSPIVVDNHIVIGSRGRKIYKLSVL